MGSGQTRPRCAVLLELSIDNLAAYNTKHGQVAGDAVLKQVASKLTSMTRRSADLAARLLGTRFVAVLPDTSEDGAVSVARRFRANIDTTLTTLAADKLVVHVGTATMRPDRAAIWHELQLEALAHRALALAQARRGRRLALRRRPSPAD